MSNMVAILKFKMAPTRGRFRVGSQSKTDPTVVPYKCAKFHNFSTVYLSVRSSSRLQVSFGAILTLNGSNNMILQPLVPFGSYINIAPY